MADSDLWSRLFQVDFFTILVGPKKKCLLTVILIPTLCSIANFNFLYFFLGGGGMGLNL